MRGRGPWRTLRGRLALAVAAGLLTAAIVFAAVAAGLIRSQSQVVARAELDRQTVALADALGRQAEERASRGEALQLNSQAYLDVIGGPRTRIYYSGLPLSALARQPADEVPATIAISAGDLARDGVQRVEFQAPGGEGRLEGSVAPVHVGNEVWGHLVLARPPGEFASAWPDVAERVLLAAGVGLGVALLLSLFLTGRVTRPLTAMQAATHRVAAGNLRTQLGPTGTRELDELAADFNRMVRDLAQRDGATQDFLMRITHDLRTPLTAVRGHAAALSDGVVPEDDVPRSLQAIESEAERLERLVADLLDLARIDAKHFRVEVEPIDTAAALARAFDAMEAQAAPRAVTYESQIDALPSIVTDGARLRQIVGNLLDNAIHWTPPGGTVRMEGRAAADGGVIVTVSDSGPGIPLERREEIFTPFASAETPGGRRGAGLGLAISRELARALGGDLRVEARLREGSRFVLELPAVAPAGAAATAPAGG